MKPHETVGAHVTSALRARPEDTAPQVLARLAAERPASVELAIGTQSEAIAVRGLSLTRAGIGHLLAGELRTGMLLPWWLSRAGRDPALGSGPAATVIQDVVSLLVYFAVVRAFGL